MNIARQVEKLIEKSSLGTPRAKMLRARTTDEEVAVVHALLSQKCVPNHDPARESPSLAHIDEERVDET